MKKALLSHRKFFSVASIVTLLLFVAQTVIPLEVLASRNSVSSEEFQEVLPTFPSLPRGIQDRSGIKNPEFYAHHLPDPVNVLNGNLFLAYQDLSIPARGFPLEISRTYNSRGTRKGLFGIGWSSSLETSIEQMANGSIQVHEWDGSTRIYYPQAQVKGKPHEKIYTESPASSQYIVKKADGSFARIMGNGKKEIFSRHGKIIRKEDIYGNGLTFTCDPEGKRLVGVSDTSGRKVWLKYTDAGFLHSFTDPLNRTVRYDYDGDGNLVRVTNFDGGVTSFSYDPEHNLTGITLPDGGKITNIYDTARDLIVHQEGPGTKRTTYSYQFFTEADAPQETVVTDANGGETRYRYLFTAGRVSRLVITDPLGGQTIEQYDSEGNLIRRTDPNRNSIAYHYDGYGRMQSFIDPMGGTWEFGFLEGCSSCSKPTLIRDPLGNTTRFRYNDKFELVEVVNALGQATHFSYNSQGDLVQTLTANGAKTRYQYDPFGNLIRETDRNGNTVQYIPNVVGLITELVTAAGHRHRFRYDAKGRLIETTNPMGARGMLAYDSMDRIVKIGDGEGHSLLEYNTAGLLESYRDPKGNVVRLEYDALGNVVKIIDPAGNEWRFGYDRLSRLVETIDPLGNENLFEYDRAGNLRAIINPLKVKMNYSYDRNNRLMEIIDPLGHSTRLEYDPLGEIVAAVDAEGHKATYVYDPLGRLISASNALGGTVKYHRDEAGNVLKQVDAAGNVTQFEYDPGDRLVKMIDPLGNATAFEYNASNQLAKLMRPDGRIVRFEYNALNLVTKMSSANGLLNRFSYNKRGQLIAASGGKSAYRFRYDESGLLTEVEDTWRKKILRHTYDSRRNRIETALLPDGLTTRYEYDRLSRLVRLTAPTGKAFRFGYDAAGRRSSLSFPNGLKTAYRYDAAGRPIEVFTRNPKGKPLSHERYHYDRVGNITSKMDESNRATSYAYDSLNRLIEVRYPDHTYERFTYDPTGNIMSRRSDEGDIAYTYDKASQLLSAGETRFEYDPNGNLIQKAGKHGSFDYRYDDLGRLVEITSSDGKRVSFGYSPVNQRIFAKDEQTQIHTIFDGDNPVATLDRDLKVAAWTLFGPGFDEPLAQESGEKAQFFHPDVLGSIISTSDKDGGEVSQIRYAAFGQPDALSGPLARFSFTGRPFNPETGLMHFRLRDYDPGAGRFIQREPLGLVTGWENSYTYAGNNPISFIDPYGLWSTSKWIGAIAVGVAVAAAAVLLAPVLLPGTAIAGAATAVSGFVAAKAATAAAFVGLTKATTAGAAAIAALKVGAAGGATVSAISAAVNGKDALEIVGDAVVGGVTGGITAAAASAGAAAGAVAGVAMGAVGAKMTGGNPLWGAVAGGVMGGAGGWIGKTLEGSKWAVGIKDFGTGSLIGGVNAIVDGALSLLQGSKKQDKLDDAVKNASVPDYIPFPCV